MSDCYVASGRVHIGSLLAGLFPLTASAAAAGWALHFVSDKGYHIPVILPGLLALFIAGILYLVIDTAHCRNRWIAVVLAALAGVVMLATPFLVEFLRTNELAAVAHWTSHRMDSVVSDEPSLRFALFMLAADAVVVGYVQIHIVWRVAGRAYCEASKSWMSRERAFLPAGIGESLLDVLNARDTDSLRRLSPAPLSVADERCEAVLEYCPTVNGAASESDAYLSLFEHKTVKARRSTGLQPFSVVRQFRLTRDQLIALASVFPELSTAAPPAPGAHG